MLHNKIEAKIKVKGRAINEYFHEGEHFVEGRGGSNYEIEVTNHTGARVEAIISVDGLCVVDGKEAGANSSGFVIDAYQTINIPGWMIDDKTAASFEFAAKKKSYASNTPNGSAVNNGVIGVMAFSEKKKENPVFLKGNPIMRGVTNTWHGSSANSLGISGSVGPSGDIGTFLDRPRGICASNNVTLSTASEINTSMSVGSAIPMPEVEQSLGTGFGKATDFTTQATTFERGDMLAMIVLYYDNAKGLRARGIELDRKKVYSNSKPSAFPAMNQGCTPPPGWKG